MNTAQEPNPAQLYDDYLVPGIHARWVPVLLEYGRPKRGDHVLDVACGTGVVARNVAPLVGPAGVVVALDLNPSMLEVARSLPPPDGPAIEWEEGDASKLPEGPFDLVLCQQGFQFFPDRMAAAREMHRVLGPQGRVVVSVFQGLEHHELYASLLEAEAHYLGMAVDDVAIPFSFGDAGELRRLLTEAGFEDIQVAMETRTVRFPSPDRFVALTLLSAAAIIPSSEMDAPARARMIDAVSPEVQEVLQKYVDGDTVAFPMHALIATAHVSS